jgi:hypothetical protein
MGFSAAAEAVSRGWDDFNTECAVLKKVDTFVLDPGIGLQFIK